MAPASGRTHTPFTPINAPNVNHQRLILGVALVGRRDARHRHVHGLGDTRFGSARHPSGRLGRRIQYRPARQDGTKSALDNPPASPSPVTSV